MSFFFLVKKGKNQFYALTTNSNKMDVMVHQMPRAQWWVREKTTRRAALAG